MAFETVTGTAPSHWACYFMYGDVGDMTEQETAQADQLAEWLGGNINGCDDAGFIHWHDARQFGVLASDCQIYIALIET